MAQHVGGGQTRAQRIETMRIEEEVDIAALDRSGVSQTSPIRRTLQVRYAARYRVLGVCLCGRTDKHRCAAQESE